MFKNILANKKLLAVVVALIVIIVSIVIVGIVKNQDSVETGKSDVNIDIEKDKDDAQENDDEKGEPYNGTGLEIMDEVDETVDSVDSSGDWDKQDNKTDDTQFDDTNQEDSNVKGNDDDEEKSDEDILVDDKVWGAPS